MIDTPVYLPELSATVMAINYLHERIMAFRLATHFYRMYKKNKGKFVSLYYRMMTIYYRLLNFYWIQHQIWNNRIQDNVLVPTPPPIFPRRPFL
jgi:hypothetical protein